MVMEELLITTWEVKNRFVTFNETLIAVNKISLMIIKIKCVGNRGSCPDVKHRGTTDSVTLLHSAIVNGFSMITFKRPQLGRESYARNAFSEHFIQLQIRIL
jgi:hypothetical protein